MGDEPRRPHLCDVARRAHPRQLCQWSSRAQHEVPLLGGEFAWIAMRTPEPALDTPLSPPPPHGPKPPTRPEGGVMATLTPRRRHPRLLRQLGIGCPSGRASRPRCAASRTPARTAERTTTRPARSTSSTAPGGATVAERAAARRRRAGQRPHAPLAIDLMISPDSSDAAPNSAPPASYSKQQGTYRPCARGPRRTRPRRTPGTANHRSGHCSLAGSAFAPFLVACTAHR